MSVDTLVNVLAEWLTPLCIGVLIALFGLRLLPAVYHDGRPDRARFRLARAAAFPAAVSTAVAAVAIWVGMQLMPALSEILVLCFAPTVLAGGAWSIELSRRAVLTQNRKQ